MTKKDFILPVTVFAFSFLIGFFSNDLLIGGSILATGLLYSWYASKGKRINYIASLINCILIAYVAYKNNLYGTALFCLLISSPLQIKGFFSWSANLDKNNDVKVRKFTLKNSIIIIASCFIGSCVLACLLSLIPSQRLAFLDALSNCIDLCGTILMILRFKEAWWLWLATNSIDVTIWTISFVNGGYDTFMVLLTSIGFLLINIFGLINWSKNAKFQKLK